MRSSDSWLVGLLFPLLFGGCVLAKKQDLPSKHDYDVCFATDTDEEETSVQEDAALSAVGPEIIFTINLDHINAKMQVQEDKTQALAKKADKLAEEVQTIQNIIEEKRRTLSPKAFKKWRKERTAFLME